jgi:AcrR family transcriptional regulator
LAASFFDRETILVLPNPRRKLIAPMEMRMAKTPSDAQNRLVDAFLDLVVERGWDGIELHNLAEKAQLSLAELRDIVPSKGAVLGLFVRRIDKDVLAAASNELAEEPEKDRVFDVMMRRIDRLSPHKEAVRAITRGLRRDPVALAAMNGLALNSMRYMLAAASIDTEGPLGALKLQGAVLVFARVVNIWLEDNEPDLARTMAALDRELTRGGQVLAFAGELHRITAPLRDFGRALCASGARWRERSRSGRQSAAPPHDDEIVSV